MSALSWLRPDDIEPTGSGRTLQPVAPRPAPAPTKLSRLPFLLVLAAILGVGMLGLLVLNTTLQNQSFQLQERQATATSLSYTEADLQAKVDAISAPRSLAEQATALGMRPNTTPVFLVMPDGRVLGRTATVEQKSFTSALVKSPAQLAQERAEAAERERAEKEKAEKEKAEQEKAEQEKAEQEKAEQEKAEKEKAERDRNDTERTGSGESERRQRDDGDDEDQEG